MKPNPVTSPTCISFSGGRTSGMMTKLILDEHDGTLPPETHILFANTGKERPETLDFVQRCAVEWDAPIVWLEWRMGEHGQRYAVVSHNSASRDGEPFKALIEHKKFLPNQVARFCTQELKIRVMRDWMKAQGYKRFTNVIGFRADEETRVSRAKIRCASGRDGWDQSFPLYDLGIDHRAVKRFWSDQPFELGLADHDGNCDLCFLKSKDKRRSIMYDRPDLAEWWMDIETEMDATFRPPFEMNYAELFASRRKQTAMFDMDALDLDCACTD